VKDGSLNLCLVSNHLHFSPSIGAIEVRVVPLLFFFNSMGVILYTQFHHEGIEIPAYHLVIMIHLNLFYHNSEVECRNYLSELPVELAQKAIASCLAKARALSFQNVTIPQVTSYSGLDHVTDVLVSIFIHQ
jgi:hypothetical protein